MFKNEEFEIILSSDSEYEKLCAEIYYEGDFVAIISQEQGPENTLIQISPPKKTNAWTFKFLDFLEVLKEARNEIL